MVSRINVFKERLRQLRLEKSLTLDALGAMVSVTRQAIIKFESGKALPSFWVLYDLADALEADLNYLTGRSDDPEVRK